MAQYNSPSSSGELPDQDESEDEKPESKKGKKKESTKPKLTTTQWWRSEEFDKKPHQILDGMVKSMEDDQSGRYAAYKEYERLFGSAETSYGDDSFRGIATDDLSQNELQNTIETLWAQVFKNRIVPAVSVNEADWDEWDRAKSYSRWLEGALDEAEAYECAIPQAGIYSLVHGTGPIKVGWKEIDCSGPKPVAQITVTAKNPRYLLVDRIEAKHGFPRNFYEKDHVDRWVLFDAYKEESEGFYGTVEDRLAGIERCTANDDLELGSQNTGKCDMLTLREAWHLPSGPDSDDGKHVIWINGCTLVCEEFSWDTFPYVFIRFGPKLEGFWGESAVRRLAPSQKNLDKLNRKLDEAQSVMGVPRIIIGNNANVKLGHVDDIPGGIILCDRPDQIREWNAQCATPELYNDRDSLPRKMKSLLGISDFEATQQIPQSMRDVSGAMLERWTGQGPARHAMFHGEYENAIPKLAYLMMRQAEDLQAMGYDVVVRSPAGSHNKSAIEQLSFKDVHVDRSRLKVKVQSMSDLPQTFAGKVDALEKMKNANVAISQQAAMRMLEIPDVQGAQDELVSDEEIIFKNLTHMCKTGEYLSPLPFDNHDLIIQMATRYINKYRVRNDADGDVVALLAQYIDDAIAMKRGPGSSDPNAPPPSTLAAVGGGPIGMPPMGPQMGSMPQGLPPMAGPAGVGVATAPDGQVPGGSALGM